MDASSQPVLKAGAGWIESGPWALVQAAVVLVEFLMARQVQPILAAVAAVVERMVQPLREQVKVVGQAAALAWSLFVIQIHALISLEKRQNQLQTLKSLLLMR